jgi:hypothetical protein
VIESARALQRRVIREPYVANGAARTKKGRLQKTPFLEELADGLRCLFHMRLARVQKVNHGFAVTQIGRAVGQRHAGTGAGQVH